MINQHYAIINQCIDFRCKGCQNFFYNEVDREDDCTCVFEGIRIIKNDGGYKYTCENYSPIEKEMYVPDRIFCKVCVYYENGRCEKGFTSTLKMKIDDGGYLYFSCEKYKINEKLIGGK